MGLRGFLPILIIQISKIQILEHDSFLSESKCMFCNAPYANYNYNYNYNDIYNRTYNKQQTTTTNSYIYK